MLFSLSHSAFYFQEKLEKRADIVWKNGVKNIPNVKFLFKLFNYCLKYDIKQPFVDEIKNEIWSKRDCKEVWSYIASKELDVSIK